MKKFLVALVFVLVLGITARAAPPKGKLVVIDNQPLHQVIELIAVAANVNIVVKWDALELDGIEKENEVSLRVRNVSYERLLRLVLEQVSSGELDIAYEIDDGIITISTKEDLSRHIKTTVYDIADLVFSVPDFRGRQISLDNIGQNQGNGGVGGLGGFGAGGGSGLFGGSGDGDDELVSNVDPAETLLNLIRSTIDPTSWRVSGGAASATIIGPQVIVTNTATAHSQLRDL